MNYYTEFLPRIMHDLERVNQLENLSREVRLPFLLGLVEGN